MNTTPNHDSDALFDQVVSALRGRDVPEFPNPKVDFPVETASSIRGRRAASDKSRWSTRIVRIAAAVLIAVGVGTAAWLLNPDGSGTALAQVQEALRKVRSATYTITQQVGDQPVEKTTVSLLGRESSRAERPNGVVFVLDTKRKRMVELRANDKKAIVTEGLAPAANFSILDCLSRMNDFAARVQPGIPSRRIDGTEAIGFVVDLDGVEYNVWVHPETNLPLQLEFERELELPDANGVLKKQVVKEVWTRFRYDVELDESLFTTVPPQGYVVKTRQSQRPPVDETEIVLTKEEREAAIARSRALIVKPHEGLGPLRFGMTAAEVIDKLGEPDRQGENELGEVQMDYLRLGIHLRIDSREAGFFKALCLSTSLPTPIAEHVQPILDFAGRTDNGIGLGSTLAELQESYGDSDYNTQWRGLDSHRYHALDLAFMLKDGKVVEIQVQHNAPDRLVPMKSD